MVIRFQPNSLPTQRSRSVSIAPLYVRDRVTASPSSSTDTRPSDYRTSSVSDMFLTVHETVYVGLGAGP